MARVALGESKIRARRRRRRLMLLGIALACAVTVFGALALLSQEGFWRISRIQVVGTHTVSTSTVESVATEALSGEYLYIFPKDNILLYPKAQLKRELLARIPSLASAQISADTFSAITIDVVERQPKALWCGSEPQSAVPCFLLDENGVAYSGDLSFEGDAYKQYFGALSGSSTPKQYLSAAQFRSLSALVDTLAASQQDDSIQSVWVDANQDVHAAFASGFTLLFTLSADGGDIYQRFTLALEADPFKQHKLSDFEYLDLRFGDKLYYKLKSS